MGMRKFSSKWVTGLLTVEQKQQRAFDSELCLVCLGEENDFLMQYVTMNTPLESGVESAFI